jgi:hypothetical protein
MKGDWLEDIDFSGLDGPPQEGDAGDEQPPQRSAAEHLAAYAQANPDITGFLVLLRWDKPESYHVETARFRVREEDAHYLLHRYALTLLMQASRRDTPPGGDDAQEGGDV